MIVSHEHKFIFVHLKRTSGRAIQSALTPYLGPDDISTPMMESDEGDDRPATRGQNCAGITRHATALEIRDHVGTAVWDEYFKFAMERNPWDKILSRYWTFLRRDHKVHNRVYTTLRGKDMSLEYWLRTRSWKGRLLGKKHYHLPCHHRCYTDERGELMIDFIARFEHRAAHLAEVSRRIGVEIDPEVRVGTSSRQKRSTPYSEFFSKPWMREVVERVFAPDLELLGYRFGEPAPEGWIERARTAAG